MESLIRRQFICGIFLLLVAIGEARGASTHVTSCETREVSIQQLTEPEEGVYNPLWDKLSGKLYYMNPWLQRIYLLDPATGKLTYAYIENGILGVMVPVKGKSNEFVVGAGRDFALVTWDTNENSTNPIIEVLGTVESNKTENLIKGGKADSKGRLWAGTMGPPETVTSENPSGITPNQAAVYRLTADQVIKTVISPVSITRGMAWNKAGTTFYFADTPTLKIAAYDFDAERGEISNGRIAFDFSSHNISGRPGGITVDSDDNLWIANYYEGSVIKVDPVEDSVLQTIELPVGKVTDVAWGGDAFDILYVTTSRRRLSSEVIAAKPKSGSVFAIEGLGARGFAPDWFSSKKKSTRFDRRGMRY